eukprot:Opistho-2@76787
MDGDSRNGDEGQHNMADGGLNVEPESLKEAPVEEDRQSIVSDAESNADSLGDVLDQGAIDSVFDMVTSEGAPANGESADANAKVVAPQRRKSVPVAPPPDEIIMSSWAEKEGGGAVFRGLVWSRRWFVLERVEGKLMLTYYREKSDNVPAHSILIDHTYCARDTEETFSAAQEGKLLYYWACSRKCGRSIICVERRDR